MQLIKKILPLLLILLLGYFQYRLWFQVGGILDSMRLKKELSLQLQENAKLKKRNEILSLEIEHFRKNKNAIEMQARRELGMIKKGETFYQVIKGSQ